MSKKLYEESNISDIASAIREKNGTQNTYTTAQMPGAIRAIHGEPILETLSVTENGDYIPSSGKDGFGEVHVNVPAGSADPVLQEKTVTANGIVLPDSGYDGLSKVVVSVSGGSGSVAAFLKIAYTAGAVCTCSNGTTTLTAPDTSGYWVASLPSAGNWEITTTLYGVTKQVQVGIEYADSISKTVKFNVGPGYTEVEYLEVGDTTGPYIDTGVAQAALSYFDLDAQYIAVPANDTWLFGANGNNNNQIGYIGQIYFWVNSGGITRAFNTNRHIYSYKNGGAYIDGALVASRNGAANGKNYYLFSRGNAPTNKCRVYSLKIYDDDTLVRDFYPCYRNSDNEPGMYDNVNDVFYPNKGSGSFILGPDV